MNVVCLGVGKGATNFLTGEPSTAYVLTADDGAPLMLMDCGSGVGRSLAAQVGPERMPADVYLSHNHTDHAGDLPVYLAVNAALGRRTRLLGHPEVLDIVRRHRLHELSVGGLDLEQDVDWLESDAGDVIRPGEFELRLVRAAHSYVCYGFVMYVGGAPLLGWSSDCRFDAAVFETLQEAPTVVVHGRDGGTFDHASLEEIDRFAASSTASYRVSHYEQTDYRFRSGNVRLLRTGERVPLAAPE